jgi:hypothetical protein
MNTLDIQPKSPNHISLAKIIFGFLTIRNVYSYQMFKLNNLFANGDSDYASEKRKHILHVHITTKSAANQLCFAQHCSKQSIFPPICRLILYLFRSAV